jgi:phage major head subunit gpT-like protein
MKPLRLRKSATIKAAAGDAAPTFELVAYNGGPLALDNYDLPVVIDLAGLEVAPSVVANWNHDPDKVVGHVVATENDGNSVTMRGALSHAGESRDIIVASAKSGFPYQASVEVRPDDLEQVRAGETVTVNGKEVEGPAIIARTGYLYGIAFVPRGADESTSVSIAARAARVMRAKAMELEFEDWLKACGINAEGMTDEQKKTLLEAHAALKAKAVKAEGAVEDDKAVAAEADKEAAPMAAAVRWDASDIRAAHEDALDSLDSILLETEDEAPADVLAKAKKDARKGLVDLKAKAAKGKWSRDKYESKSKDVIAAAQLAIVRGSRPSAPAIHASARDMNQNILAAAVCQRLGLKNVDKAFDEKTNDTAHREFGGRIGLQQLLIMAAASNGYTCRPGERVHVGNLREVLEYAMPQRRGDIKAAGFSTLSLPGLLSNVANKELLEGYMEEDQTWKEIAAVKSVNDFKQVTTYRMLDDMQYELLPKGGKIRHGTTGEQSFTRQARTYAKMYSITREDIVNDDLSAFDALRDRIGRGAAMALNDKFWTTFMDNSTFYTSGNSNYIEGATTNLGADGVGLSAGVKAFRTMRSPSADGSKRVGGPPPTLLLVPPELESIADGLYVGRNVANVKVADANIHAGKYRPVVVPWLSDTAFTGYSTTAWYLFRAPNSSMAPVVVSFLDGVQTPTVESSDADFDQLGIQFRGYHDFGVDMFETLAGIKSKGAA